MKNINDFARFTVVNQYSKLESETLLFNTREEAEKEFNKIAENILWETNRLEDSHWRNNTEGLSVELRELTALPQSVIDEMNEAETDEERDEIWNDNLHTYSTTLKTRFTYLSDDWNEEKGEFEVKEKDIDGGLYASLPFSKDCVSLVTGEVVTLKGAIQ